MKNGTKKNISKIPTRDNNIKVKKKSENNTNIIKQNIKPNKNKEYLFNRTSFNTNSNFYTITDFLPKYSTNKNAYKTLINSKKSNLNMKNKIKINDFEKINYKFYTNRKSSNPTILKDSKRINILKDKSKENIANNFSKEIKNLRQSLNSNKYQKNKINNTNDKIKDIHLLTEKANNSYEKIKQIMEISSIINHNQKIKNQKNIKGNKNNIKPIDQINNNINSSPLNMNEISNIRKKILPIKKNNSTTNSKYEINNNVNNNQNRLGNNSYYSCYNFYQKDRNSNNNSTNKNNYNYNKMLNTINNFEFHNYSNIYQIEDKMSEKIKNKNKNYILVEKENIYLNKEKPNIMKNKNLIPRSDYKKYTKNGIYKDINNNNKIQILEKFLNRDRKKLIEYKKKLIQYFCKAIEDFIFLSVKKNFNYFIQNLKQVSTQKNSHYLLLKRLQNKAIQKNFYKEKGKTSLYSYLNPIENNFNNVKNIKMNDSNMINKSKNEDENQKDISKGYVRKKNIYNLNRTQSPSFMEFYNRNDEYFDRTNYDSNITPDIENKENLNYLNRNIYNDAKKFQFNKTNINNSIRNNLINENINFDLDQQYRKSETYIQNNFNHNKSIYVPKKFKLINNSKTIPVIPKENDRNNNSYVLSPLMNYALSHNIFSKKLSHNKRFNQSHELSNDPVKSKLAIKKFNSNNNCHEIYNMSCNYNNSNYNLYKENNIEFLNNTNDNIMQRNNRIISGKTFDTDINERNCIYKKKLKVNTISKMYSKPKSTKIRNQILDINFHLNNNFNGSINQFLSPNIEKNTDSNMIVNPYTDIIPKQSSFISNLYNYNNMRVAQTEPRRELYLTNNSQNKFGNIKELTVNLSKNNNNNIFNNNEINNNNKENIFIYSKNDFDNCLVKESENINNNNDELNNENILINEVIEENDENFIKEIIIKDVSSSDKRLNVFIKYIEMQNINENMKDKASYDNNILKYFHIDSLTIKGIYPKKTMLNIYYKNYCYGNRDNKIKFNKILSSIMEEEEKSKAAGSINNSTISDEENSKTTNNFSHFFTRSLKYFSDLIQSIFDDKKKGFYHKFFKILKKIKNEAFLQGLITEKKYQTLNHSKNEGKEEEKENENEKGSI